MKISSGNTIVHPKKVVQVDDLPYQCQHFIEMFLKECKAGQEKQVTKAELLEIFKKHGFKTRGNPWYNFHFYRRTLIKRGVMKK
jgi:hypothetical protein